MALMIIGLILGALGGLLMTLGRRTQAKANVVGQVPVISTADLGTLLPGEPVALAGTIRCDTPLTAEISKKPCVYYDYQIERQYEVREKTSKGEWETKRRTETVASHKQWVPFTVEDAAGRAQVRPDRAEFDVPKLVDRFEPAKQPAAVPAATISLGGFQLSLNAPERGSNTVGYRYTESLLAVGTPVYVLGVYQDSGEITAPPSGSKLRRFIISHRTADELHRAWQSRARWFAGGAIASAALGVLLLVIGLVSLFV